MDAVSHALMPFMKDEERTKNRAASGKLSLTRQRRAQLVDGTGQGMHFLRCWHTGPATSGRA